MIIIKKFFVSTIPHNNRNGIIVKNALSIYNIMHTIGCGNQKLKVKGRATQREKDNFIIGEKTGTNAS